MSTTHTRAQPSEEELRAYEEEIRRIRVEHILFDNIVTLVNLGCAARADARNRGGA